MAEKQIKPTTQVKTGPSKFSGPAKPAPKAQESTSLHFIFDRGNYLLFIIAIVVVALGFVLMSGTTEIYSTTKIVIAPLVVLGGFAIGFLAIFKKPSA